MLGKKQSGLTNFQFADIFIHQELLASAFKLAKEIINLDPKLQLPTNQNLKILLKLFGY